MAAFKNHQKKSLHFLPQLVVFSLIIFFLSSAFAAPSPNLWPLWQAHAPDSTITVDHRPWDLLLQKYLVSDHPSGINLFRYGDVSREDRKNLDRYLDSLQQVDVSSLNRKEQLAYWIDLYNTLTVKVILDH